MSKPKGTSARSLEVVAWEVVFQVYRLTARKYTKPQGTRTGKLLKIALETIREMLQGRCRWRSVRINAPCPVTCNLTTQWEPGHKATANSASIFVVQIPVKYSRVSIQLKQFPTDTVPLVIPSISTLFQRAFFQLRQ
jgi:hypothetical protein